MKYTVALGVLAASAFADKLDVNPVGSICPQALVLYSEH